MDEKPTAEVPDIVPLESHYVEASLDYRYWSRAYNMHFGFWRWGLNPLSREPMLEELTEQVARRISCDGRAEILDMGCGLGAPVRDMARHFPEGRFTGITRVSQQIEKAEGMTDPDLKERVSYLEADFTQIPLPDCSQDGIYAMEAICHLPGLSKRAAIAEAARLLKPGARFVVADGFLRKDMVPFPLNRLFSRVAHDWALDTFASLPRFCEALDECGFELDCVENISLRIGPSALHTPFVSLRWLISEAKSSGRVSSVRWRHVTASLLAPLVGLAFPWFGYYVVTATKK